MRYPDRKLEGLYSPVDSGGILLARRGGRLADYSEDQLWFKAKAIDQVLKKHEKQYNRKDPSSNLELIGILTSLLKPAQARGQLIRLDFLFSKWTKKIAIGESVQRLVTAGKLDWAVMDTMRTRFPEIYWPKKLWGPENLPKDWKDVSRDKLRAPHTWPKKWRVQAMGERLLEKQVYKMKVYGEFVLMNFDVLYGKEIAPSDAMLVNSPDGDLELFMRVGLSVWNGWVRINRAVGSGTVILVPLPSERKATATDARAAMPKMKAYRRLFERAPKGEFSQTMRKAIDIGIEKCKTAIRDYEMNKKFGKL